jgi:hypothetical protein
MKKLYTLLVITIATVGFTTSASAQSTANATVTTTLITPLSIAKTTDMNFGTIAATATAGTVVLDYANALTPTGGVKLITGGAAPSIASFTVTGEGTSSFSIQTPTTVNLTGTAGGSLSVDNITADLGGTNALIAGSNVIKVKGTLTVPANAVAGVYNLTTAADFFVTVNYN